MMIEKIVSGGQAGVERAALETAIRLDIAYGGWIPQWRKVEDASITDEYRLQEMPNANYVQVTEQKVRGSDGTLIISRGKLTRNSALSQRLAERHRRPLMYIDLNMMTEFEASRKVGSWIRSHGIEILNVTGPKDLEVPDVFQTVSDILESAFHLSLFDMDRYTPFSAPSEDKPKLEDFINLPNTVGQAVDMLLSRLTFKERTKIANTSKAKLMDATASLRVFVKSEFRLWEGNEKLMASHGSVSGGNNADDVASEIVAALWERLQTSNNVLRVVK